MSVSVLQGHARLFSFGEEQLALSGTTVSVPINDQLQATGPPTPPRACVATEIEGVPFDEWQCDWVELHLGEDFGECPAVIPFGMDLLFSQPLPS